MKENMHATIGVFGLGVMGGSLLQNFLSRHIKVIGYNHTAELVEKLRAKVPADTFLTTDLPGFIQQLEKPRKILLMVKAGEVVDLVLQQLVPLLDPFDIVIDGGNSHFKDTERRSADLKSKGIHFVGLGVSGGENGALHGPSMMAGCSDEAYKQILPYFSKIAAHHETPCIERFGEGGAGHFVKMVHNGIEYGLMQLIAEIYDVLRKGYNYSPEQIAEIFYDWNNGDLKSYLVEITSKIVAAKDPKNSGRFLLDSIIDRAGSKGTGRWTVESALELGVALPVASSALFARYLSSDGALRSAFSSSHVQNNARPQSAPVARERDVPGPDVLKDAFHVASIICFFEGLTLIERASVAYGWESNLERVTEVWRSGCIIRSELLDSFGKAYKESSYLSQSTSLIQEVLGRLPQLQTVVEWVSSSGIPLPSHSSALWGVETLRRQSLPQKLIQAQRDFFGAHGVEVEGEEGLRHLDWPGV